MRPECWDALSALCDGEVVDPDLIREGLADPDAADYLVSIAAVRAELCDETDVPSAAFNERMLRLLAAHEPKGLSAVVRRLGRPPARLVILGTAAGLVAGLLAGALVVPRPSTPTEERYPARSSASARGLEGPATTTTPAIPQPVRAPDFAFRDGQDWTERGLTP